MWRHSQTNRAFDSLRLHLGECLFDIGMPMAHANESFENLFICVQSRFKSRGLFLGLFENRGTSADLAITFTHFLDNFRCGGTVAAYIEKIRLYLIEIIRSTVCHDQ